MTRQIFLRPSLRPPFRQTAFLTAAAGFYLLSSFSNTALAHAQSAAAVYQDEIIVTGRYLSLDKLNAVKTPTPILNVPQSLTILPKTQIADQAMRSLSDVMRYMPGLSASQGEGHRDAIIIRGQQTTADFFLDGMRDDVQYFRPLYNIEQVEVLRGTNALLFGRGGGGGVVNRVAKKPEMDTRFTELTGSVDSFGANMAALDINQPLTSAAGQQSVGLRVNGFVEHLNNHRDFYDGTRFGITPALAINLSPDTHLDISYEYLDDDRTVDRGVPSQNAEGGPDIPLKGYDNTFFGSSDDNTTTLQASIFRARLDHNFSNALRGNFTTQYADYDKLYQNLYASRKVYVANGTFPDVELDGYQDITRRQNLLAQANLVGEATAFGFNHTILAGLEYGDQDTDNARNDTVFAINGDDRLVIDFTDPLSVPAFSFSNPARKRASSVSTFSAYIQDQIELGQHVMLLAGARFDSFDIDVSDMHNAERFTRQDEEITPRLGAIYKPAQNVSLYASYGQSFLPRSGDQFLTLDLDTASTRPQSYANTEIGAKWDIGPALSLTSALFELTRESYTSVDPEDAAQLITIDGSKTKGFEVQLTGEIMEALTLSAGYSYLDGKVEDIDFEGGEIIAGALNGNAPRQTPKHMASLWSEYTVSDKLRLGAGAAYQDSFYVREDNKVRVPSFLRFDAAAFYDVSDNLRAQINIENLTDAKYYPDAHSNTNISTGKPLSASLTLTGRF